MTDTELKNRVIEKFFEHLNSEQMSAVLKVDGANLILAGAGSGKTATVCNRVMNMLLFGNAYYADKEYHFNEVDRAYLESYVKGKAKLDIEKMYSLISYNPILANNILVVTFTKKAANELKERVEKIGISTKGMRVGTFHSVCNDILRKGIHLLSGYKRNYQILDKTDSEKVIKQIVKKGQEDGTLTSQLDEKDYSAFISSLKNKMLLCSTFQSKDLPPKYKDFYFDVRKVFTEYEQEMRKANKLDFDDLLLCTVLLLKQEKAILEYWQNIWKYIMVDEYQDTNGVQYEFVKMLSGNNSNIMVVGDENQSIYKFRGADIEHILNFEREFKANKYLLEQNYRSTDIILSAANNLIENNSSQLGKNLWTNNKGGSPIDLKKFYRDSDEVQFVINEIQELHRQGIAYKDMVVLSRMRWLFTIYDKELAKSKIPYEIVGKIGFLERREIKDVVAFLQLISNPFDYLALHRMVGIISAFGNVACTTLIEKSKATKVSVIDILKNPSAYELKDNKGYENLRNAYNKVIDTLTINKDDTINKIVNVVNYLETMKGFSKSIDEYLERVTYLGILNEKWDEFLLDSYEDLELQDIVTMFINEILIDADDGKNEDNADVLKLMTIHAAKGLEYNTVFIIGASEGIMPCTLDGEDNIEEERRIGYVAVTRAKCNLYLVHSTQRKFFSGYKDFQLSRFVKEMKL